MTDFDLSPLVGIGVVLIAALFIYDLNLGYRLFGKAKERERLLSQVQADMVLKDVEARQAIQIAFNTKPSGAAPVACLTKNLAYAVSQK